MRTHSQIRILVVAFALLVARSARAEQAIIKQPGEHPHYFFEAEPHLLLGWHAFREHDGPGVGFRGTIPLVFNGFVSSINNSVGIGFGFDVDPLGKADHFSVPVVMQWNFWLSTHWSVFGEPGAAVIFGPGRGERPVVPVLYAGGRLHFSEVIALTLRVGYPDVAIGVSFLL